jgi:hypothetical protein
MKPEKRYLLHDLLDGERDGRREATLLAGGRILRRKRWRRVAFRSFAAVTLFALATFSLQRMIAPRPPVQTAVAPPPTTPVRSLTDAELLALFPGTPVGLATLENGRKQLIFPRAGDEGRFIKRL